jgi:hypothetical protein
MARRRSIGAGLVVAGAAVLGMTALTPPARAGVAVAEGTTATCTMDVGSVTASGDHTKHRVTAGTPPTMTVVPNQSGTGVYSPGQVRLSSTFVAQPELGLWYIVGWVVQGDVLSRSSYVLQNLGMYLDRLNRSGSVVVGRTSRRSTRPSWSRWSTDRRCGPRSTD